MAAALPTIKDMCHFSDDSNPPNKFHTDNKQKQEGQLLGIETKQDKND